MLQRAFFLVVASLLSLLAIAPGCGRSSLELETRADAGSSSTCGPSTCPGGCCDANGQCRTGTDVRACGSVGGRCSDCVANGFEVCTSSRVCGRDDPSCGAASCPNGCCAVDDGRRRCLSGTEPAACGGRGEQCTNCGVSGRACEAASRTCGSSSCTPDNCNGCCVGDQCLPGDAATACGASGGQCQACGTGQTCNAVLGRCEGASTCGPANCNGCCDAAGRCVGGNDTTACGTGGQACQGCAINQVCVPDGQPNARSCQVLSACGPTNCAGCCVGNQCVVATTPAACGINGQACQACGAGLLCTAGQCTPPSTVCNALNCATCCVGDVCAVGTQNTACGVGGGECLNCVNQNPTRVCQSGVCQLPACGPTTCPNGCCDGNTCVVGTQDGACGPTGGAQCADCTLTGQVCQGRQCRDRCGPANCGGCCQANNNCAVGIESDACGDLGLACADCTAQGSFCNGLVEPRRCNNQQTTCPAAAPGCSPANATPVRPTLQNVCSDVVLAAVALACRNGPDTADCATGLAIASNACRTCLGPFLVPFDRRGGLWACAAPSLDATCRQATGCATNCADVSCDGCAAPTENQCRALVADVGGQCRARFDAAACANPALQNGQFCSQFSYPNFGAWLRAVGDRFCGNGP